MVITEKEFVSAIFNCVKRHGGKLIDEKAMLIALSLGAPIDDFYEVDGRISYRGVSYGLEADCDKYLAVLDKYGDEAVANASKFVFDLIRRGKRGELSDGAKELLAELGIG